MLHRAVVLIVLMVLTVALLVLFIASGIASLDGRSLVALAVVLVAAAISGIAFSWNRYFKRP